MMAMQAVELQLHFSLPGFLMSPVTWIPAEAQLSGSPRFVLSGGSAPSPWLPPPPMFGTALPLVFAMPTHFPDLK